MENMETIIAKHRYTEPGSPKIEKGGTSSINMTGVQIGDYTVTEFAGRKRRKGHHTASMWVLYNPQTQHSMCLEGIRIRKLLKLGVDKFQ